MSDADYAITALVFILAGLVKGVIGMGLPTVAVALLSAFMHPAQAAALMVVPSLLTNVWQGAAGGRAVALVRRLWPLLAGVVVGTFAIAASVDGISNPDVATAGLGVSLMLYAGYAVLVRPLSVSRGAERWLAPVAGLATGAVSAMTGVFVMPSVPYLQALNLPKDELVQAMGMTFTVATVALAFALMNTGHFDVRAAGQSAACFVPALLGMLMGQLIRRKISVPAFRSCFFLGMFLLGLHLAIRPLL